MKGIHLQSFSSFLRSSIHNHSSVCFKCGSDLTKSFLKISSCEITRGMTTSTNEKQNQSYIPRRTLMYVPGHDSRKLQKIPKLGVDCAVLECEDGVALNMKEEARKNIKSALQTLQTDRSIDLALRVNSVSSGLMELDLEAVVGDGLGLPLTPDFLPQTILLPKVDTVAELETFTDKLKSVKLGQSYCPRLITYVESGEGLMNMREVLQHAVLRSKEGIYTIDGVVFGSDDFCADIGAERTKEAKELTYARQKVLMVAKAFRLQAIDMVFIDIHDKEGLKITSEEGARLGYTGRQVIHPGQVDIVNAAFTPSSSRVEWATQLVLGFKDHQASGQGAFTFRGQMIDMPLLKQAQNVLQIASKVKEQ